MSITKKIALTAVILFIISTCIYLLLRWHYEDDHDIKAETKHATDTLRVGIIGDSWVFGQTLDTIMQNAFTKNNVKSWIMSSGQGGANSSLIYSNMFLDGSETYSSNKIFNSNLKYCVVIAGVNDAIGQYGGAFYSHHIRLIISDLLKDHIRPVVVTLPEFGIVEAEQSFNIFKSTRNKIFGHFTGNGFESSIRDYRKILAADLAKQHLTDSIVTVDFDSVIMRYQDNKALYRNPPHLNVKGNQKLGPYIVKCILRDMKNPK